MRKATCVFTSILLLAVLLSTLPVSAYNQGRSDAHALMVEQSLTILRNDGFSDVADTIDVEDALGVVDQNLDDILRGIQAADDQFGRISLELLTDDTANWNAAGNTHYYNPAAHHAQSGLKIGVLHGTDSSIYHYYGSGIAVLTDMVPGRGDPNRVFALRGPQPSPDRLADWYYAMAVEAMRSGRTSDAYFNLGKAIHMVQDATVPHHGSDHYGVLDLHQAYENGADTYMEREVYLATTAYPHDPAQSLYFPDVLVSRFVDSAARTSREWIDEITEWWGFAHTENEYAPAYAALLPLAQQLTAVVLHKFHQRWSTEPYSTVRLTVHRAKALDGPDDWAADLFTSLNVIEPGESASSYSYDFSTDDFVSGYFGDEDEVWPGSYLGYDVWAFCYTSDTVRAAEEVEMVLALWDDDDIDSWTHSVSGSPAGLYNPDWLDINPDDGYRLHLKTHMRTGQVSRWTGRDWQIIGRTGEAITSVGNQSGKSLALGGRGEIEFTIDAIYVRAQVSQPPQTPRNRFPGTIEDMVTGVTVTPTLYATSYVDFDGDPQRDSEWRIMDASDRVVFHNYGGATSLQDIRTPLEPNTLYKWQVRYQDSDEVWSGWSRATLFMTDRPPQTPVNELPAHGATGQPTRPDLTASVYSDPEGNPQLASEWEVVRPEKVLGAPVFLDVYLHVSEGEGNSHHLSEDLAAGITYAWRVRYRDLAGVWSEWSERTSFVTTASVIVAPPMVSVMPALDISAPDGGENLLAGSKYGIRWTTTGIGIVSIDIDYTSDFGKTWVNVAGDAPNTGIYEWILPATPAKACLIRITGLDSGGRVLATGQSDDYFSIYAAPVASVTVGSPKQGEAWRVGTVHSIVWKAAGQNITYINIDYSTDGGKSFRHIAGKLKNSGSYSWTVPQTPSQMALVRVFAVTDKGETVAVGDSGLFLITLQ